MTSTFHAPNHPLTSQRLLWKPRSVRAAIRLQERLRGFVIRWRTFGRIATIAALDCAHARGRPMGRAAVAVYRYPSLEPIRSLVVERTVRFPYVPGLLSFRELPLMYAAIKRLPQLPDLFLVDGHGIAHPRRFGIASGLGVLLDRPSIGCAKSVLIGEAVAPLPDEAGVSVPLRDEDEVIGALVRPGPGRRLLVVSIGHRIDLASAIRIVLSCCDDQHRLPVPLWEADRLVCCGV